MNTITINEFKEKVENNVEICEFIKRKYIPIMEKQSIINNMLTTINQTDDELYTGIDLVENNSIINQVLFDTEAVKAYTTLDFEPQERFAFYDQLVESEYLDKIIKEVWNDYFEFKVLFRNRVKESRQHKLDILSIQSTTVVSQFDELVEPVSTLLSSLTEKIKAFNVDTINEQFSGLDIDAIIKAYSESDSALKNHLDVLDTKNEIIRNLRNQLGK